MKDNQYIIISGTRTILVPYRKDHVLKYHSWMKSTELQELTASEPLSLEEEYQMQISWREDPDKCTFIILDKEDYEQTGSEIDSMIGDVNFFFNDEENPKSAEIEIMIAEPSKRRKGMGREALLHMIRYGLEKLGMKTISAKIKLQNQVSIKMFKDLQFKEVSTSEVFQEMTLLCEPDEVWGNHLLERTDSYRLQHVHEAI